MILRILLRDYSKDSSRDSSKDSSLGAGKLESWEAGGSEPPLGEILKLRELGRWKAGK